MAAKQIAGRRRPTTDRRDRSRPHLDQHLPRLDEPRQRVDVVIGNVGALIPGAQIIFSAPIVSKQHRLDRGLVALVAVGVDEGAFMGNQGAVAVGLDPPASPTSPASKTAQAHPLGHAGGDLAVIAVDLFAPSR